jgi:RIO-like serine/threonine protein kinase
MSNYKIYIHPHDNETGELGSSKPKKAIPLKRTLNQKLTFNQRLGKSGIGESRNIEDRRTNIYDGNHLFQLWGYLTRNTWFHLASRVKYDILSALQSHGFGVFSVSAWDRDKANSQYYFEIHLRVLDEYSTNEVINSLVNTLEQTIALRGSIRFSRVIDYSK